MLYLVITSNTITSRARVFKDYTSAEAFTANYNDTAEGKDRAQNPIEIVSLIIR